MASAATAATSAPTSPASCRPAAPRSTPSDKEGEHVLFSAGATTGGEGDGGQINSGLFGALIVEPAGSLWYRSQVTQQDLALASTGTTTFGQPTLNYDARYPAGNPRAGQLILGMLDGTQVVATDLTAIIAGSAPNAPPYGGSRTGAFPSTSPIPSASSRSASSPSSTMTRRGPCRPSRSSRTRSSTTPCRAAATPSPSTTAPPASAPRCSPTASASAPWPAARSASSRSSYTPLLRAYENDRVQRRRHGRGDADRVRRHQPPASGPADARRHRSEEHTSELQSRQY